MSEEILTAENEFIQGNLDACNQLVNKILTNDQKNIQALLLRARLNYNWQKWGDSLNDLNRILEIDADHKFAKNYKLMVLNILTYWNKDNYNP